tara:strand:- start:7 stop:177 length:171 start_codon:yes stop_codon:yes gene_type:complete
MLFPLFSTQKMQTNLGYFFEIATADGLLPKFNTMTTMRFPVNLRFRRTNHQGHQRT